MISWSAVINQLSLPNWSSDGSWRHLLTLLAFYQCLWLEWIENVTSLIRKTKTFLPSSISLFIRVHPSKMTRNILETVGLTASITDPTGIVWSNIIILIPRIPTQYYFCRSNWESLKSIVSGVLQSISFEINSFVSRYLEIVFALPCGIIYFVSIDRRGENSQFKSRTRIPHIKWTTNQAGRCWCCLSSIMRVLLLRDGRRSCFFVC